MRETCTSGSVRGEGGNLLTYSARKGWVSMDDDPSAVGAAPLASCYGPTLRRDPRQAGAGWFVPSNPTQD